MDWTLIGTLAGVLGLGTVLNTLVTAYMQRRTKKEDRDDLTNSAAFTSNADIIQSRVQDGAALRQEIWTQLKDALARNDGLSQELGNERRQSATFAGESQSLQRQVNDLVQRLSARDFQIDELGRKFTRLEQQFELELEKEKAGANEVRQQMSDLQRYVMRLQKQIKAAGLSYEEL